MLCQAGTGGRYLTPQPLLSSILGSQGLVIQEADVTETDLGGAEETAPRISVCSEMKRGSLGFEISISLEKVPGPTWATLLNLLEGQGFVSLAFLASALPLSCHPLRKGSGEFWLSWKSGVYSGASNIFLLLHQARAALRFCKTQARLWSAPLQNAGIW